MYSLKIAECCKKLKLGKNIVEMSNMISAETHQEYLFKILEKEVEHRMEQRKNRLINNAGFKYIKLFDKLRFDDITLPATINIEYLKDCEFMKTNTNIVMYGNAGTGKTHLSIALGIEACKQGKNVKFFRTSTLVNTLAEAKKKGELLKLMRKLEKADLLICDEWGYVPLDRTGAQLLFEVISECYERKSVIINTNNEFSRWVNVFYDEQMTGAIIDRLLHHCHLLLFPGTSIRMEESTVMQ